MSEWRECKLGDVVTFQRGHDLPKTQMNEGIYPVAGSNGIIGYHNVFTTEANGVTIGRSGNIGTPHFYKTNYWAHNTVLYVKDFKGNYQKFVYYFLKTLDFTQFNTGSAVPSLNRNHIHELEIIVPDTTEQKAIAAVLSSLDDKIDLLHRQNLTLEAMAEMLFRQWFVVEAQEDWEEGILGDLVEFNYGKTLRDQERSGYGFPVYGSSGIVGYHNEYLVKAPGIITGRKGTLGVINYSFHNFFPIDTSFYITSKAKSDGLFFEYFLLKTLKLDEMNSDSAVPGLNKNLAHGIQLTIPPIHLIKDFNQKIKPVFEKLSHNQSQIQTLESLRDTLLPKLMSGEVRVALDA